MISGDFIHITSHISCWTNVGASILRLCSLYQIYKKGPSVPGPMQPLSTIYHHVFVLLALIHGFAVFSVALALGVASQVGHGSRPLIVSGSLVVLSMTGQVRVLHISKYRAANSCSVFGWAVLGIELGGRSIRSS